ncbi:class I SAM-dependent methyltransferase, partial [Pseudorhizobium marinum]|uniref:class I SAM-dependent methyltransferase n=1 Tax=Pseudorhizobium marinum TaxID=1496690 RepID=UPI0012DD6C11
MSIIENWSPSKAEYRRGKWRASRDRKQVHITSRINADRIIAGYEYAIKKYAKGDLVDLGCGQKPYGGIYSPLVSRSIGVDWESSLHDNRHVDVFSDLNENVDLPDDSADTILCTDVLEHIFNPLRLWDEMARIARDEAILIVGVPFFYWLHEEPHDHHRYTRHALRRYATEAKFEVVEIWAVGGYPHVFADLGNPPILDGAP